MLRLVDLLHVRHWLRVAERIRLHFVWLVLCSVDNEDMTVDNRRRRLRSASHKLIERRYQLTTTDDYAFGVVAPIDLPALAAYVIFASFLLVFKQNNCLKCTHFISLLMQY